jgi:hypothetical protein
MVGTKPIEWPVLRCFSSRAARSAAFLYIIIFFGFDPQNGRGADFTIKIVPLQTVLVRFHNNY